MNPNTKLIMSDLSYDVISDWSSVLIKEGNYPNVKYCAFDFCKIPFKDESIDIISDAGGIFNALGSREDAYKECFRVLKKDGILITSLGYVTKNDSDKLPYKIREKIKNFNPSIFESHYDKIADAGFKKIDSITTSYWYTDNDDSDIANFLKKLKVNLKFSAIIRYCYK